MEDKLFLIWGNLLLLELDNFILFLFSFYLLKWEAPYLLLADKTESVVWCLPLVSKVKVLLSLLLFISIEPLLGYEDEEVLV